MEQFHFSYTSAYVSEMSAGVQELIAAAVDATGTAYAPYSNFKVGAAIRMSDGTLKAGANHENASYPAGICAERALLGSVNMNEGPTVLAMAIAYKSPGDFHQPLSPCGICRQTILEVQLHQQTPIEIYMCSPDGMVIHLEDARHLLPFYFSNEYL